LTDLERMNKELIKLNVKNVENEKVYDSIQGKFVDISH